MAVKSSSSAPAPSASAKPSAKPSPRAPTAPSTSSSDEPAGQIRRPRRSPPARRRHQRREADLVLTGLQSEDLGLGQTGVILAELLGLPHATLILKVEKTDTGLKVKRELEEGWFQHLELPSPPSSPSSPAATSSATPR